MRVMIENRVVRAGSLMEEVSRRVFHGEGPANAGPPGSSLAGMFKEQDG